MLAAAETVSDQTFLKSAETTIRVVLIRMKEDKFRPLLTEQTDIKVKNAKKELVNDFQEAKEKVEHLKEEPQGREEVIKMLKIRMQKASKKMIKLLNCRIILNNFLVFLFMAFCEPGVTRW